MAEGIDVTSYPSILRTISEGKPSISGLVSLPVTDTPIILVSSSTKEGNRGNRGVLVIAIDRIQAG